MKNRIRTLIAAVGIAALLIGCATQSTIAYKSLSAVEAATVTAYTTYLQGVVAGTIPTNSVPSITRDFMLFQSAMQATVAIASQGGNAPATQPINDASTKLLTEIATAKVGVK